MTQKVSVHVTEIAGNIDEKWCSFKNTIDTLIKERVPVRYRDDVFIETEVEYDRYDQTPNLTTYITYRRPYNAEEKNRISS